jgi:hypothetical protein
MGLDFIREKAKRFTQQRDKSKLEEFDTADLLRHAKEDKLVPLFRSQLDNLDTVLILGLGLVGIVSSDTAVTILQRGKKIGLMLPSDAAELTRLMKLNSCYHGVVSLVVVREASIDGIFVVKAKKGFKIR